MLNFELNEKSETELEKSLKDPEVQRQLRYLQMVLPQRMQFGYKDKFSVNTIV